MATRQLTTKQVVNLASDPASGIPGEIYYNTASNVFKYYNGVSWTTLTGGGSSASDLSELGDVSLSSLANNHILSYDDTTSLWKNQGLAAAIQEVDGPSSGIDADTVDGKHASDFASLSIGSTIPEAPENGALFFNQDYGIFYIGFGNSWLEIGSIPPLDGGESSTTIFSSGILDGGDSSPNIYSLDGGSIQEPYLLA